MSVPASVEERRHAACNSGSKAGTAEKPSMPRISATHSVAVMRGALGGGDVGLGKIVAFVEQRLAFHRRERVGEAITKVKTRGVASFAEATECLSCDLRLLSVNRYNFKAGLL